MDARRTRGARRRLPQAEALESRQLLATTGPGTGGLFRFRFADQVAFDSGTAFLGTFKADQATNANVVVERIGGALGTVRIPVEVVGGTAQPGVDFEFDPNIPPVLEFAPGVRSQVLRFKVIDREGVQPDRTLILGLGTPDGAGAAIIGPARETILIRDMEGLALQGARVREESLFLSNEIREFRFSTVRNVRGFQVTFDRPLDQASAIDRRNYILTLAGPSQRFNPGVNRDLEIQTVSYDPDTYTVTVTPIAPILANHFVQLTINPAGDDGVRDLSGQLIDGDTDGRPGGRFVARAGFGDHLTFSDGAGDRVNLNLAGGGTMVVATDGVGNPRSLRFLAPRKGSVLTGSLRPAPGGDGQVTFPVVIHLDGVQNRLPSSIRLGEVVPITPRPIFARVAPQRRLRGRG